MVTAVLRFVGFMYAGLVMSDFDREMRVEQAESPVYASWLAGWLVWGPTCGEVVVAKLSVNVVIDVLCLWICE